MSTESLIFTGVTIYMVLMIAVGLYASKKSHSVTDFMVGLFDVVDPEAGQGSSVTAREILDEGAKSIDTELAVILTTHILNAVPRCRR